MKAAYCLDCDRKLQINGRYELGDIIVCPSCDSEFVIVGMGPPEIDWLYEDDADDQPNYDDYDDEDELEEEGEVAGALPA